MNKKITAIGFIMILISFSSLLFIILNSNLETVETNCYDGRGSLIHDIDCSRQDIVLLGGDYNEPLVHTSLVLFFLMFPIGFIITMYGAMTNSVLSEQTAVKKE